MKSIRRIYISVFTKLFFIFLGRKIKNLYRAHLDLKVLEIGPALNPSKLLAGFDEVQYADIMSIEEILSQEKYSRRNKPGCSHNIDIILEDGLLSGDYKESFDLVLSVHSVEHHYCFLTHLENIYEILRPGGRYFCVLPYPANTFDRFTPLTKVSEILRRKAASGCRGHDFGAVLDHLLWKALGVSNHFKFDIDLLKNYHFQDLDNYTVEWDIHRWVFTPTSIRRILQYLKASNNLDLEVGIISQGLGNSFFVSFEKRL